MCLLLTGSKKGHLSAETGRHEELGGLVLALPEKNGRNAFFVSACFPAAF